MNPLIHWYTTLRDFFFPRRAKTPTMLQMEVVECGAASLGMVLGYYGRFVPLEELRHSCGVSRDGAKAINVVKAARSYGLKAGAYKKELRYLKKTRLPAIILWNFTHFLVLEGLTRKKAFLNDPKFGPRTVSIDEFDRYFSGFIMTFEPGPDFTPGGRRPSVIRALARRLKGVRTVLIYVVLVSLLLVIPGLVLPSLVRAFVDNVLINGFSNWLPPILIGLLGAVLLGGLLTHIQQLYLARMETKLALTTTSSFFWHILRLPITFFTQRFGGEIGSRVMINDKVGKLLSRELASILLSSLVIVFYALVMLHYDVYLTTIGVAMAGFNLLLLIWLSRKQINANRRLLQERGKGIGVTMHGLQMIESVKAMASEPDLFVQWSGNQAKLLNSQSELGVTNQILAVAPPFLMTVNLIVIITFGGYRVMDGAMTVGMLIAFVALMMAFATPINRLAALSAVIQEIHGDLDRLDDVLQYPIDPYLADMEEADQNVRADAIKLDGYLELKSVTFGYSSLEKPLIEDLNIKLHPGQRVALVGASGSGKSTIAKLVCGIFEPWDGSILFDGRRRTEISRPFLTNSMAMVDQDIFLFEGTVWDNLTLWDSTMPEINVSRAAKDACIHDDIIARPGGYRFRVSEGGRNFSGGQRQRLEIARALVNNPSILILDEATSALDPIIEKTIDENLRRRGCTCLIVAHRLSTIRDCDEILVFDRGKIVERGNHEELCSLNGTYLELIGHD